MSSYRTYEMEVPPEPALPWNDYGKHIIDRWNTLLNEESPSTEAKIQAFLERYPCMIPGVSGQSDYSSSHCPYLSGVISQAPLPSYNKHVPDFMWISKNSAIVQPVLIEIEDPSKKWFTQAGQQTAVFTQALNQILDWKTWFEIPHNVSAFKHFYSLDRIAGDGRQFKPAYILIYGRQEEFKDKTELTQKRAVMFQEDITGMTYDRLRPDSRADQYACLKAVDVNTFSVISVPATLKWSPLMAGERAKVGEGWIEAINSNEYISDSRKKFLIERHQYWENWGNSGTSGTINTADEE